MEEERGKVTILIEKATKTETHEIDPRLLKSIKSTVKNSDSEIKLASQTLLDLMKTQNSQVRYSTLLIIDELFMRSKLFRNIIIENIDSLLTLSIGFRHNLPLPGPLSTASELRKKSIELLEKWNLSFGLHYKELRLSFDYLKNTLKFKFPDVQANVARVQRERLEREARSKEILVKKFEKLRKRFEGLKVRVSDTVKEINECLEAVQWRGDDGVGFVVLDEEDYEEIRCVRLREMRFESLRQEEKVEETSENRVVFDVLREKCKVLVTKHLVSVEEGISLLIRVDVSDNRIRDDMLKECIDIKNEILRTKKKYEDAGFTYLKVAEKMNEEEEEDIWEEDDGNVGTDVAPVTVPSLEEAIRSTTSEAVTSTKRVSSSGDPVRDKLISEAPVMNWGSQLSNWDSTTEVRANHRGLEVESHWGRVDQDAVIPADKIAELNLQATVYREERTETPPCRAPLKKGGLCQRRDLRLCPFHGEIVPRDDEGNPIITTGIDEDVSMEETTSDSDPNELARQIANQALKNIREEDNEARKKRAKKLVKLKVKEHNFEVLREAAMASTSRSAVVDEEFDKIFAARQNKKSSMRRKKTTAKDRISGRLFSNRSKASKPMPLSLGDDEKCRDTAANQW